jgi:type IV pilus assembly protein PilE
MHDPGGSGRRRRPCAPRGGRHAAPPGFTLIELMIVVVVIGVLATIAYPGYQDQARRARRADAIVAITQIQQAQERWRANHPAYADQAALTRAPTATPPGLGLSAGSPQGYYSLGITGTSGSGYTLTATAVAGGSQSGDAGCTVLTVTVANGAALNQPAACWSR